MPSLVNVCGRDVRVAGRLLRIARLEAEKYQFLDDPEPVVRALRKSGIRIDLFTFMQRLPETSPKYAYPMEWDNLAVLPVSTFDHWWTQQIGFKARNKAKQAEKRGVTLREVPFDDALVRGIWEVYNECPVRQGRPFTHYGKDVETVRKEEATFLESSVFIGAFFDGKLIGFVKLVADETRRQAGLMNIVSMIQHRDKAPTNALVAQAVRSCAERGIPHLVYSNFAYGKKQQDSVSDFKERNGFQRVDLPRYYVPLTRVGWAGFRLGLHRRFADRLPEPLIAKLRELRNTWYNRKLQPAMKAS
ncbi:MAG: hypothetical protein LAO04_13790 [Acidobacteriia bacterium]|jgi:hypothetical protein|nr:hypothetical protein [Terriglobia bacterium]